MNQISFMNDSGITLRGVLQPASPDKLVIMCHGFRGNRSSRGRFDRLATTFQNLGFSVLRFDFGGCGDSDDRPLTLAGETEDVRAALTYASRLGYDQIALYGHSLGARVSLEAFDPTLVKTMILTGAGTGPVSYDWSEEFTQEQLRELQQTGAFTHPVTDPYRTKIVITRQMLADFEQFNQKTLLSQVTCPTLIVHGTEGEEATLMPLTKQGMRWLPKGSRLEIIDGAPHDFLDYMDDIEQLTSAWLCEHF
ncbi:alpha/beta hydrolase [Halobacillus locisalis]|uniref:Alpha/beta hydrolase n=1 Tax=Halobacillus locisalis TaxID=220753 RepID=A0A838CSF2_9BACI|nr:alpha/beta hydrolase [Halobacillus locisalis]MBA2175062.1 alpha/beta hydrolase [Halobacillus locisalis]